jgi:monooxygenase
MELSIEGKPTRVADHFNYKGAMFSDIPNMTSVFGYVNASWTLKADIVAQYACRLLNAMDAKGAKIATPHLGETDMPRLPFVSDFSSSYFARSFDNLPKNGDRHRRRVGIFRTDGCCKRRSGQNADCRRIVIRPYRAQLLPRAGFQ